MCSEAVPGRLAASLLLVLLLVGASCSVKEDRCECPCWLTLDLTALDEGSLASKMPIRLFWSVRWDGGEESGDQMFDPGLENIVVTVPKTDVCFSLCCGDYDGIGHPCSGLTIPEGCDCPAIYSFAGNADARMEECPVPVTMHKCHCVMDITLRDIYRDGAEYVIRSDVAGYDSSWIPVFGTFNFILAPDEAGRCSVSLPRQIDNSMKLCVFRNGELDRIFSLGEYVAESGYDWDAPDLADISLEIDYTQSSASFNIDQWKKTLTFTVVI